MIKSYTFAVGEGAAGDAGPQNRAEVPAPETGYHNNTTRYHW